MSSSATGVGMPICFLGAILLILTQKSSQKFGDVLGIMVTTKSGAGAKKGLGVSYSAHVSMDNVMRWPDYQYEFGQGQAKNIGAEGTAYAGQHYYS